MSRSAAILLLLLPLTACHKEPEVWTAFVYPPGRSLDAADAQKAIYGTYKTFEECQNGAIWALRDYHARSEESGREDPVDDDWGDYECGVGCRYESEFDLFMCKETRK